MSCYCDYETDLGGPVGRSMRMKDPTHEDMKATARARAAQAWTTEKTKNIEMDARVADAFADILVSEWEKQLLNEAEKRAEQLQTKLDRCEEAVSNGRTEEDCQPGDLDWSETLRKTLNLHRNYQLERKRNSDLIMGGKVSVDREKLLTRISAAVFEAFHYAIEQSSMPFAAEAHTATEMARAFRRTLATLAIPYERENPTDFSTKWDQYVAWREGIDEEHLLDEFDLALGWFAGQGFSHDQALQAAGTAQEAYEED